MPRRIAAFLLCLLLAAPVARAAEGFPRVVVDALGREVTIPAPPQRIVAIFASNVEILAAIGAGGRIAGIEAWTRYPPELLDRPKVGGRLGFSVEAIARLQADLVVMTPARSAASLVEPLGRIGIPALVLHHRDLASILGNIRLLGRATGLEDGAARVVAGMERRLAAIEARLAGRAPVAVYLETGANDRGTYLTARDGTYTADLLRLAGGRNVFAGDIGISQIGGEAVFHRRPDAVVVAGTPQAAAGVAARPGWAAIPAVRDGRVIAAPRALLLIPGPRVVDGVEFLARALHPEAFEAALPSEGAP